MKGQNKMKKRILYFANFPTKHRRSIGGITTLAKSVYDFLKTNLPDNFSIEHKQIRKIWAPKWQLIDYFFWLFKFPFLIRKYDLIHIFLTHDMERTIGPLLVWYSKLLHKKVIVQFGGGLLLYPRFIKPYRYFYRKWIFEKSDFLIYETKALIVEASKFTDKDKIIWLPNSRFPSKQPIDLTKSFSKTFAYISRIIPQKGIDEIIRAAKELPKDYKVVAYGFIDKRYYHTNPFTGTRVEYKGVLRPEKVSVVLQNIDVILIPTYYEGEGYPGIIIEAFSQGVPVISTHWRSIPEIVKDRHNGRLVEPRNAEQLKEAILTFNENNYPLYRKNAYNDFNLYFNANKVYMKIINAYISCLSDNEN